MAKKALKRLELLQKRLYEKAYNQAARTPLVEAPEIIRYSENFYKSLTETATQISYNSILAAIENANFLLYGDFHTFKQTQKGLIRILRSYIELNKKRPIVLALEMFRRDDQDLVNRYIAGQLEEKEFLEKCQYSSTWGFPWQNYKVILEYAKLNQIEITGISTEVQGKNSLHKRDKFAAQVLNKLYQTKPDALIVCLIGEYHLADQHLPIHLDRKAKFVRVLANIDHYYFSSFQKGSLAGTEYIKLKDNLFCVINAPPWIKWQSYSIWEELKSAELESIEEGFDYTEETFDLDYQIVNLLNHLNDFLKLGLKKTDLYQFQTYLNPDETDLNTLFSTKLIKSYRHAEIRTELKSNGFSFIPETNTVVIKLISLNNLAEVCGQLLYHFLHPVSKEIGSHVSLFYQRILMYSCGVLTSKILNPRRKCNDLYYYYELKNKLHRKRLTGYEKSLRAVANKIISISERWKKSQNPSIPEPSMIKFDSLNYGLLTSHLGHLLGYYIYNNIINNSTFDYEFTHFFQFLDSNISPSEHFLLLVNTLKKDANYLI